MRKSILYLSEGDWGFIPVLGNGDFRHINEFPTVDSTANKCFYQFISNRAYPFMKCTIKCTLSHSILTNILVSVVKLILADIGSNSP